MNKYGLALKGGTKDKGQVARPLGQSRRERVLLFQVGEGVFGIEMGSLAEAIYPKDLQFLSNPYSYCAKFFFRGQEIPVLCLNRLFGFPERGPDPSQKVLVTRKGGIEVGFLVDRILEMVEVDPEDIMPMSDMLTLLNPLFFRGVILRGEVPVTLLNPTHLAGADEVSYFYSQSNTAGNRSQ